MRCGSAGGQTRESPDVIDAQAWIQKLRAGDRCRAAGARGPSWTFLEDTLDLVGRYARIEKLVLGRVDVAYSPASLSVDLSAGGEPATQAEALAIAERARLNLPAGPILDLERLIEAQGIKVVMCGFPAPSYAGGFFFDASLGPCILLPAGASESEKLYALAHQYAHFLADFDPYITTLCALPSNAIPDDPVESRAHAAALALLMPQTDLQLYRDALEAGHPGPVSAQLLDHLHVYFDLDPEIVLWRLTALGWIGATQWESLLAACPERADGLRAQPVRAVTGPALLPDRFVRLVASAFGSGRIDLDAAAAYFGTDSHGAEEILGQFEYEAPSPPAPEGAGSRLRPKVSPRQRGAPRRAGG